MELTKDEKFEAILTILNHDGSTVHSILREAGFGINIVNPWTGEDSNNNEEAINIVFAHLSHEEYLKKKQEFTKQPRNNKGRFKSWKQ